ncbi:\x09 pre-mRNA splicing factor [Blumeria hordei DH14]|uniref:\x09 pre-mRNA splicing factor n=1 Tax=Blumeria graminis f. sp. hordei (strain DH14) TaxID=546991 RepID=N1J636_BLUG1|nr:\x09 pre-mRNA splicing factor [Blumeria hordei DH14]
MSEVSSTRLYLGNLPRNATKADVEAHFNAHGTGEITEIKLMNGFGFIEYKDALDARDVVPAFHGSDFMGERLTVQFARGSRSREAFANTERIAPRPRRTPHRMQISGLPGETSWQDLKDFARQSSLDVVYSETGRDREGKGSFVEFETAADLKLAVEKLDGREFKGVAVTCVADTQPDIPRDRARSRSPGYRRSYPADDYERRAPNRGYSPRRDAYRDRSVPRRGYYEDDRTRYGRSPPRARAPTEEYPPPRRGAAFEEPYRRDYPSDPYVNGRNPRDYAHPRDYPHRDTPYEYERPRRYW